MKKFISLCSLLFLSLFILSPSVIASPETSSGELKFEQKDGVSLNVDEVINCPMGFDNGVMISAEKPSLKSIYSIYDIEEVNVEPVSSQFFIKRIFSGILSDDLNLLTVNERAMTDGGPLEWAANSTNKKRRIIKHRKIKNPNVGYKSGPLRYTVKR